MRHIIVTVTAFHIENWFNSMSAHTETIIRWSMYILSNNSFYSRTQHVVTHGKTCIIRASNANTWEE